MSRNIPLPPSVTGMFGPMHYAILQLPEMCTRIESKDTLPECLQATGAGA